MLGCTTFVQWRLILGITLGLAMVAPQAMAAPLCSEVLKESSTPSLSDIERTVESIARYRLDLDLQKSAGTLNKQNNPGLTEALYQEKYKELISAVKGTHTEKEIRKLISQNIARLQNVKGQEDTIEKKFRSEEVDRLRNEARIREMYKLPYQRTSRIQLDRRLLYNYADTMEFVPKNNSLLMVTESIDSGNSDKSILLLDLKTHAKTALWASGESTLLTTKISSNRKFLTMLATGKDEKGELFFYDIQTATHKMIKLPDEIAYDHWDKILVLDINPSGTSILLVLSDSKYQNKRAFSIDTQTGKATAHQELAYLTQGRRTSLFISDHEFLFLETNSGLTKLKIHNLRAQLETPILPDLKFTSMFISPDLSNLFFQTATDFGQPQPGIKTLATEQILDAEANLVDSEVPRNLSQIKPLPHNGLFVRQQTSSNEIMVAMPDMKIEPTLVLTNDADPTTFVDMTIDPATQRLFFHSKDINGLPIYLDIWTPK